MDSRIFSKTFVLAIVCVGVFAAERASALQMTVGGYAATPFMTVNADGLEVGPDGTLYLYRTPSGVLKVTPDGSSSPWCTAVLSDLAVGPTGEAFGTEWNTGALLRIAPSGSFSTLPQDSIKWGSVAIGPDGTLYAAGRWNDLPGAGGVFVIDPSTGNRTLVVAFEGISHSYGFLEFGSDGRLYAIESTWIGSYEYRLARLDGAQFTSLGVFPHFAQKLASGPNGTFWVLGGFDYGSGYPLPEIWMMDAATGIAIKFADSWVDHQFWGIGYDRVRSRIYIGDPALRLVQPDPILYVLTQPTPVQNVSWGRIKSLYR